MIDFGFGADTKKHPSVAEIGYPTYHTAYETFDLIERIVDPDFKLLSLSTKFYLGYEKLKERVSNSLCIEYLRKDLDILMALVFLRFLYHKFSRHQSCSSY